MPSDISATDPSLHAVHVALVTPETAPLLVSIADERVRQVAKWGVQTRPDGTSADLYEEMAYDAKRLTDAHAADGTLTWTEILDEEVLEAFAETDPDKLRTELIQVAAVALAWAEDIDRKGGAEAASARALTQLREALSDDSRLARDIREGRLPLRSPGETS